MGLSCVEIKIVLPEQNEKTPTLNHFRRYSFVVGVGCKRPNFHLFKKSEYDILINQDDIFIQRT